jgi:hypothetical protein
MEFASGTTVGDASHPKQRWAAAEPRALDARDAYRTALATAIASLRRAQELFEVASAAIDAHIARSLAAEAALHLSAAASPRSA